MRKRRRGVRSKGRGRFTVAGGGGRKECRDGFDSAKGEAAADWDVQSLDHQETLKYSNLCQLGLASDVPHNNGTQMEWAISTSLYPTTPHAESKSLSYNWSCERDDFVRQGAHHCLNTLQYEGSTAK